MAPVMAFLVIGPVLDIKNLLMMTRVFKKSFIRNFILITVALVFLFAASLEVFL
ncbi:permease, partial [Streptococcus danieliae]|nr:permease [Streptococcus danieliae]